MGTQWLVTEQADFGPEERELAEMAGLNPPLRQLGVVEAETRGAAITAAVSRFGRLDPARLRVDRAAQESDACGECGHLRRDHFRGDGFCCVQTHRDSNECMCDGFTPRAAAEGGGHA